jgi:uncharacterized membrane protein YdbT with pleckstrin-like domain
MAFPRKLLTDNEEVVREFRPHWRMLLGSILFTLLGIGLIVLAYMVVPGEGAVDHVLAIVVVVALVFLALWPFVGWWFTSYVLTNERLITRRGVFSRSGVEIPLENINNVLFSQTVFERLLKSGDLLIESAGESGQSRFSDIPQPEEFQSLLYKTREARTAGVATTAPEDATGKLERLARLHRDGVLSDEEFAAKKQELLDEI